jgi:hypothetical protein
VQVLTRFGRIRPRQNRCELIRPKANHGASHDAGRYSDPAEVSIRIPNLTGLRVCKSRGKYLSDRTLKTLFDLGKRCNSDNEWALRDSNPRPAECKWETVRCHMSSMVAFVDIYWVFRRS